MQIMRPQMPITIKQFAPTEQEQPFTVRLRRGEWILGVHCQNGHPSGKPYLPMESFGYLTTGGGDGEISLDIR